MAGLTVAPSAAETLPADQEYLVRVWRTDDGLPMNSVTCVAQTPDGYLWAGTLHGGLARFNGVRFETFSPATTPAFHDIELHRLLVDSQGALWVGLVSGAILSLRDGVFTFERSALRLPEEWLEEEIVSGPSGTYLSSFGGAVFHCRPDGQGSNRWTTVWPAGASQLSRFSADGRGRIWCAIGNGSIMRLEGETFCELPSAATNESSSVYDLEMDSEKRLWAATKNGAAYWDEDAGCFVCVKGLEGRKRESAFQVLAGSDGGVWFRFALELRKWKDGIWQTSAALPERLKKPSTGVPLLLDDGEGGVWCAQKEQGLWHFRADGTVYRLSQEDGLPNALVMCLFRDREGSIWVGLENGGLARVRRRLFRAVVPQGEGAESVIYSLAEDRAGTIWLGGARHALWRLADGQCEAIPLPSEAYALNTVVASGPEARVWVGMIFGGVWKHSDSGGFDKKFNHQAFKGAVRVMLLDSGGALWLGNEFGLFRWKEEQLQHFAQADGLGGLNTRVRVETSRGVSFENPYTRSPFVNALAEDAEGALWIGVAHGELWRLKEGVFTAYRPEWSKAWMRFWALLPDGDGGLWIGTLGGGLLYFREGRFSRVTQADGLLDDNVSQILDDRLGYLWIGTSRGIMRLSKAEIQDFFHGRAAGVTGLSYGKSEGMPAAQCSSGFQPACLRDRAGRLWFATGAGAAVVQPEHVRVNPLAPPVTIEDAFVDGVRQELNSLKSRAVRASGQTELVISPGKHHLEFRFAGLCLTAPEKARFRWLLEGVEQRWVDGGGSRSASYSLLPPGRYVFRVKACNEDGIWNEQGAELAILIRPFFWQTWWFKIIVPLSLMSVACGLAILALRRRNRLQLERFENQHAMERERARIAQDLHDDLGASLTQIAWLGEAVSRDGTAADDGRALLGQITAKSREMVRAIDEIVWAVNPRNDTLENLVIYVCQFAEEFFRDTETRCRIDVVEPVPVCSLTADRRHNLFLVLKEALHNVGKHASATEVWVSCKAEEGSAHFAVEDNGRGFDLAGKATGDGLLNMRQRASRVGAKLHVRSAPGRGTCVTVNFPLEPDKS